MNDRNSGAHKVTGDDVNEILPFCEPQLRRILERAFRLLLGRSPSDWKHPTPDQKARVFSQFLVIGRNLYPIR